MWKAGGHTAREAAPPAPVQAQGGVQPRPALPIDGPCSLAGPGLSHPASPQAALIKKAKFTGGKLGMLICNDRRWPEAFRVLGLQGVELVVIGYNTPTLNGQTFEPPHLRIHHNLLTMQAGAYQNGTWVIGVAKAGIEDGCELIGQSVIVAPTGEIVAMTSTMGDEIIVAECDLGRAARARKARWNWDYNREPRHYGIIVDGPGRPAPAND